MSESIVPSGDEHLTTGWAPDLPAADTLVRQAVLVNASLAVEVPRCAGRAWRSTDAWAGGWTGDRGALTNPVVLRQPLAEPDGVLDEIGSLLPPRNGTSWSVLDVLPGVMPGIPTDRSYVERRTG
ncbi:hypothetical protein [Actinopolymorpha pittospori]|uniref:Uncharacterized protein n=1 Tax=Actinopolymorpha pittospori TaxID=648752 RepID=A0A927N5J3_9ACTN|nr:hypothetical protein [Actinopolymorpha pittospori]MBE1613085.1 hypothetical protein [Actinopolymorpha pittospori]